MMDGSLKEDGKTVADVMETFVVGVTEHRPKEGAARLFPSPRTRLQRGDELLVQGQDIFPNFALDLGDSARQVFNLAVFDSSLLRRLRFLF